MWYYRLRTLRMNYHRTYMMLVESRRDRTTPSEKTYIHHIVPKSEGGSNDKSNLVSLTAREHYIAHLLLAKMYNDQKMWCAVQTMGKKFRYNSRLFAQLMNNIVPWNKGKKGIYSQETRDRISKKLLGKSLSNSTKDKMSKAKKGRLSNFTGKHHTDEAKARISEAQKGKPKSEESKLKSSMKQGKRILQIDTQGNIVGDYWSCGIAERTTGVSNIRRAVSKGKMAGGFVWKYVETTQVV